MGAWQRGPRSLEHVQLQSAVRICSGDPSGAPRSARLASAVASASRRSRSQAPRPAASDGTPRARGAASWRRMCTAPCLRDGSTRASTRTVRSKPLAPPSDTCIVFVAVVESTGSARGRGGPPAHGLAGTRAAGGEAGRGAGSRTPGVGERLARAARAANRTFWGRARLFSGAGAVRCACVGRELYGALGFRVNYYI